ncbi:hypothetical protein HOP50_11g61710 [Chloropicon primus]|uniref:SAM domain-containing protein n=1 Tax=Chloropicon primus TaxID=1764295 RepID=A0A5B8MTB3_9CHLO|nr:hypothetical protein A3770_11p61490 [Chloropicon primus]UPR02844.1 hypothetical protein HOP50_11g61710 [Chloropicon primus]|eukprot:QDZ23631.1 hypothetical protein A3770_11p61490 [Chloropicon primus]
MGCRFSKSEDQPRPEQRPSEDDEEKSSLTSRTEGGVTSSTTEEARAGPREDVLKELLTRVGLLQYLEAFRASGYDDESVLVDISEKDIAEIEHFAGVTVLPGHRKKIMLAGKRLGGSCEEDSLQSPRGERTSSQGKGPRGDQPIEMLSKSASDASEKNALFVTCSQKFETTGNSTREELGKGESDANAAEVFDAIDSVPAEHDGGDASGDSYRAALTIDSQDARMSAESSLTFSPRSPYKVQVNSFKLSGSRSMVTPGPSEGSSGKENISPRKFAIEPPPPRATSTEAESRETTGTPSPASPEPPCRKKGVIFSPPRASMRSHEHTMRAIEESVKSKVAFLSSTIGSSKKVSWVSEAGRSQRRRSRKEFENVEDSVREIEYEVKKKIAEIIDRKWKDS